MLWPLDGCILHACALSAMPNTVSQNGLLHDGRRQGPTARNGGYLHDHSRQGALACFDAVPCDHSRKVAVACHAQTNW